MASGIACYVAGVFCVTVFGNIPMNNNLNRFEVTSASTGYSFMPLNLKGNGMG
ncbi:MAG: hypothetical protein WKG06_36665 [Segetibacter sp.]